MAKPHPKEVKEAALLLCQKHRLPIARQMLKEQTGTLVSISCLSRWCTEADVATVATDSTRAANEARSESLRERRQKFVAKLFDSAERIHDEMFDRHPVVSFSPKDNTPNVYWLDKPPAHDRKADAGSIGILMTQVNKVIDAEPAPGLEAGRAMIDGIKEAVGVLPYDPDDAPELEEIDDDDLLED
jgi:hypothetical protein